MLCTLERLERQYVTQSRASVGFGRWISTLQSAAAARDFKPPRFLWLETRDPRAIKKIVDYLDCNRWFLPRVHAAVITLTRSREMRSRPKITIAVHEYYASTGEFFFHSPSLFRAPVVNTEHPSFCDCCVVRAPTFFFCTFNKHAMAHMNLPHPRIILS